MCFPLFINYTSEIRKFIYYHLFGRVAENLIETPDETDNIISTDELFFRYQMWATQEGVINVAQRKIGAKKSKVGQVVKRLYPDTIVKQMNLSGEDKYYYVGLCLAVKDEFIQNVAAADLPKNASLVQNGHVFTLTIATKHILNGDPLAVNITLNTVTSFVDMLINGLAINLEKYGIHPTAKLTQNWIKGMLRIVTHANFCQGLSILIEKPSTVPVTYFWSDIVNPKLQEVKQHSRNCEVLLKFTKTYENQTCRTCGHDLRYDVSISSSHVPCLFRH